MVACILCVIYVQEDNDSNVYKGCDYMAHLDYMELAVCCSQKGH